jgi:hypothetical protein
MTTDTSSINSTNEENSTATVSIRNMNKDIWTEVAVHCKRQRITITEYITKLLIKDLDLASNEE